MYLLDTNVVSEIYRKRPNPGVMQWVYENEPNRAATFLSVLTLGEIRYGAAKVQEKDPAQAAAIFKILNRVRDDYRNTVLPIDERTGLAWGRLLKIDRTNVADALLAATALVNDLTLVSRNEKHLRPFGVRLLNPFSDS